VEGPQAVRSAVTAGAVVHELFVDEGTGGAFSDVVHDVESVGGRVSWTTSDVMAAMSETRTPQGVLAVCDCLPDVPLAAVMTGNGPVLVLESVSDPGNVGTMIRTADAVGAAGVILTAESADVHNGKVVRSTAGSLFHLPIVSGRSIDEIVLAAHAQGRTVAVATGDASTDLFEAAEDGRVDSRTCWVMGSEAHGVSAQARALADEAIAIPMSGRAESLNAAVASAVVLYVTAFTSRLGR
jgi:TrmH family RNA methyltransferase